MAEALNKTRSHQKILDLNVVKCAALMHDIAKLKRNHESAGAAILAGYGFSGIADIVAAHRDTDIKPNHRLRTGDSILADKLFQGTTLYLWINVWKTLERWKMTTKP